MIIDLTSTPHGPYSTLRRPHIDPTSTPHRLHIDSTSTSTNTQLLFQPSFVVKLYSFLPPHPPPPHFYSFLSITTSSFSLFFYLTSYLEDQTAGQSKAQKAKWRPNEGKKGQKKIKTAKTRTKETKRTIGPTFVILSLRSMYLKEIL